MNPEIRKLKKEFDGAVREISPERMEDIFCKRAYESGKLLWLENDLEGFERSEAELVEFIKKMTPAQHQEAVFGWLRAYVHLLYDLRVRLRSEGIEFLSVMIAHNHLFGMVLDDLETYEGTGDKYFYDGAKKLLNDLDGAFKSKFGTSESIQTLEDHLSKYEDVEDLTPRDLENLEVVRAYVYRYHVLEELNAELKEDEDFKEA